MSCVKSEWAVHFLGWLTTNKLGRKATPRQIKTLRTTIRTCCLDTSGPSKESRSEMWQHKRQKGGMGGSAVVGLAFFQPRHDAAASEERKECKCHALLLLVGIAKSAPSRAPRAGHTAKMMPGLGFPGGCLLLLLSNSPQSWNNQSRHHPLITVLRRTPTLPQPHHSKQACQQHRTSAFPTSHSSSSSSPSPPPPWPSSFPPSLLPRPSPSPSPRSPPPPPTTRSARSKPRLPPRWPLMTRDVPACLGKRRGTVIGAGKDTKFIMWR